MKSFQISPNRKACRVTLLPTTSRNLKAKAEERGKSMSALASELILKANITTKADKVHLLSITPEADAKLNADAANLGARKADILRRILSEALD